MNKILSSNRSRWEASLEMQKPAHSQTSPQLGLRYLPQDESASLAQGIHNKDRMPGPIPQWGMFAGAEKVVDVVRQALGSSLVLRQDAPADDLQSTIRV